MLVLRCSRTKNGLCWRITCQQHGCAIMEAVVARHRLNRVNSIFLGSPTLLNYKLPGWYTSVGLFCTLCTPTFRDSILKPFVYAKLRRVKSDIKSIGIGNIKYRFLFCISHLSQIICVFAVKIKFCNYIDFYIQISKRKFFIGDIINYLL